MAKSFNYDTVKCYAAVYWNSDRNFYDSEEVDIHDAAALEEALENLERRGAFLKLWPLYDECELRAPGAYDHYYAGLLNWPKTGPEHTKKADMLGEPIEEGYFRAKAMKLGKADAVKWLNRQLAKLKTPHGWAPDTLFVAWSYTKSGPTRREAMAVEFHDPKDELAKEYNRDMAKELLRFMGEDGWLCAYPFWDDQYRARGMVSQYYGTYCIYGADALEKEINEVGDPVEYFQGNGYFEAPHLVYSKEEAEVHLSRL